MKGNNQMETNDDFMVNCVISAGELDPKWRGHYLNNELRVFEIVKHNVPYSEFLNWSRSEECWKRIKELEQIGRDKFGEDYCVRYSVCHFCTTPSSVCHFCTTPSSVCHFCTTPSKD